MEALCDDPGSSQVGSSPSPFLCVCGRQFKSQRGLSTRRRHKHPADVNAERVAVLPTKRLHWSSEDDEALRCHADHCWMVGMLKKDLYELLLPHFPGRSAEAIKKCLQTIKWVVPSLLLVSSDPPPPPTAVFSGPADLGLEHRFSDSSLLPLSAPTSVFDPSAWRLALLDSAMRSFKEPKLGVEVLKSIASALKSGVINDSQGRDLLEQHAQEWFPYRWKPSVVRHKITHKWSNKTIRRANYAVIQRLYKLRRKDAAATVLSGRWRHAYRGPAPVPSGMAEFWSSMFETSSVIDTTPAVDPPALLWSVLESIAPSEVTAALQSMTASAVGLDRISAMGFLAMHQPSLAAYFNLLLVAGGPPKHLVWSRVVFIPKTESPTGLGDYRPISVASVLLRALHKILAKCLRDTLHLSPFQHAFLQRDGCLEATTLLHTILRRVHTNRVPCAMLFLDVAKAFDMVSHQSLYWVASAAGFPPPLLSYLDHLYKNSTVQLADSVIRCRRGVRQGDPLSPLLFILVIDDILRASLPTIGFPLEDQKIDCLAYAPGRTTGQVARET